MTVFYEEQHWDAFLLDEGNGYISREEAVVADPAALKPGQVIAIDTASEEIVAYDPAGSGGAEVVAGIILKNSDAVTATGKGAYIARLAEVNKSELVWPAAATPAEIEAGEAELVALFIIPRKAA